MYLKFLEKDYVLGSKIISYFPRKQTQNWDKLHYLNNQFHAPTYTVWVLLLKKVFLKKMLPQYLVSVRDKQITRNVYEKLLLEKMNNRGKPTQVSKLVAFTYIHKYVFWSYCVPTLQIYIQSTKLT